jgi:hypothetical protein
MENPQERSFSVRREREKEERKLLPVGDKEFLVDHRWYSQHHSDVA